MDVTIIVPIYNSEKTLRQCLDSLIHQKTKFKYEIICIDDGSTDSSPQILKKYQDIKIITQKNKGPGAARNEGIRNASGEYLMFVDSDDYVSDNFVDKMYQSVLDYQAEIVICNFIRVEHNKFKYINKGAFSIYEKGKINEVLLMEFHSCNRIIKKSIMLMYPNIYYEDVVAIAKSSLRASKIVKIEDYLYYYVYRDESTTRTLDQRNLDILKAMDLIEDDLIKASYEEELEFLYINNILVDLFIKLVKVGQKKKALKLKEEIEKKYPNWFLNKYLQDLKFTKKLYLLFLKAKQYFIIERVFKH